MIQLGERVQAIYYTWCLLIKERKKLIFGPPPLQKIFPTNYFGKGCGGGVLHI